MLIPDTTLMQLPFLLEKEQKASTAALSIILLKQVMWLSSIVNLPFAIVIE